MTLQNLIEGLSKLDPATVAPRGFHNPHSWRGVYAELAFEPTDGPTTVGKMLAVAQSALGQTYDGWKGGEYTMQGDTDVHIDYEGQYGGSDMMELWFSALAALPSPTPILVGEPAANSMPADWCAGRIAEIREFVDGKREASLSERRTMIIELLSQLDNPPSAPVLVREGLAGEEMNEWRIQAISSSLATFPADLDRTSSDLAYWVCTARDLVEALKVARSLNEALTQQRDYGRDIINDMTLEAKLATERITALEAQLNSGITLASGITIQTPGVTYAWVEPSTTTNQPGYYTPLISGPCPAGGTPCALQAGQAGPCHTLASPTQPEGSVQP